MKKLLFAVLLMGCTAQPLSDQQVLDVIKQRPEVQELMQEKSDQLGFIVGDSLEHPGWASVQLKGLNDAATLSINYGEYLVDRKTGEVEPF